MSLLLAILALASSQASVSERTASPQDVNGDVRLVCQILVEGADPQKTDLSEKYSFRLFLSYGGESSSEEGSSFVSIPLTSLKIEGYPTSVWPISLVEGNVEFHKKFGFQGAYANIGRQDEYDIRLKLNAGQKGRAMFEIFRFREGNWLQESGLIGVCQSDRDFEKISLAVGSL
jgi:hypothetical protein